jgi:exodeoxyribonuclease VII large subunit
VRADLIAEVLDFGKRTIASLNRHLREAGTELAGLARGLGDPRRLIEEYQQRIDVADERLRAGPKRVIEVKEQLIVAEARALKGAGERYKSEIHQRILRNTDRLLQFGDRLKRHSDELLVRGIDRVDQLGKLLESYSFHSVLNRGFALVRDQDGQPVLAAVGTEAGDTISIEFSDGTVGARVTDGLRTTSKPAAAPRKRDGGGGNQGSLL